jgi:sugar lactone lactonase YvrE
MTPDGKGGLYFGTVDLPAIINGQAPGPAALYRLDVSGRVSRLCDGLKFSNGLGLSQDGCRLYHNESFVGTFAYDVAPDGSLGPATLLLKKHDCDGIAIDCDGRVWVSGFSSNEIVRLRPDGSIDGTIAIPAPAATNVRFGGPDMRDVYVTTVMPEAALALARGTAIEEPSSVLYRARSDVAGLPLEAPRFRLR